MSSLVIANILSFGSACFTVAASWTKSPTRTYGFLVGQCLVYAAASYFFGVYASILMMLINAFRSALVALKKYSLSWMVICTCAALAFGLITNRGSAAGYIAVAMTAYYNVTSFFFKEPKAVKVNYSFDMSMWVVYDILVRDIPSGVVDLVSVILSLIAFSRILRDERLVKAGHHQTALDRSGAE